MQLLDPARVWTILFISFGLTWLMSYLWVRMLARMLGLKREMRFGWAQVGDSLRWIHLWIACGLSGPGIAYAGACD